MAGSYLTRYYSGYPLLALFFIQICIGGEQHDHIAKALLTGQLQQFYTYADACKPATSGYYNGDSYKYSEKEFRLTTCIPLPSLGKGLSHGYGCPCQDCYSGEGLYRIPMLTYVVAGGMKEAVLALLRAGANIEGYISTTKASYFFGDGDERRNFTDFYEWTPLYEAVRLQKREIIDCLITEGAKVNLMCGNHSLLQLAVHLSDTITLRQLVSKKVSMLLNSSNRNAFHTVATTGNEEVATILLEFWSSPKVLDRPDNYGKTPLWVAAAFGNAKVAALLLDNEALVDRPDRKNHMTPLIAAANNGQLAIVKLLISRGADIKQQNAQGLSALEIAAKEGRMLVVKYFLEEHAYLDFSKGLIYAASQGHSRIVMSFLKHHEGRPIFKSNDLGKALCFSVKNNDVACFCKLLDLQAPLDIPDEDGNYPIHFATRHSFFLEKLAEKKTLHQLIEKTDSKGFTALHWAAREGSIQALEVFDKARVSLDVRGPQNETPLYEAANFKQRGAINWLASHGADTTIPKKVNKYYQEFPAERATYNGLVSEVEMLTAGDSSKATRTLGRVASMVHGFSKLAFGSGGLSGSGRDPVKDQFPMASIDAESAPGTEKIPFKAKN